LAYPLHPVNPTRQLSLVQIARVHGSLLLVEDEGTIEGRELVVPLVVWTNA